MFYTESSRKGFFLRNKAVLIFVTKMMKKKRLVVLIKDSEFVKIKGTEEISITILEHRN
jgi:hypothetical protein